MPAVLVAGHTIQKSPFLPEQWPKPSTLTHCTYPQRDGQVERPGRIPG